MAMLLEAQSELSRWFSELGYFGPFTVLVLCGFGLPLPEEITMLGAGFLLYQGRVAALPIIVTCWAGTLIGDTVPYLVGRRFGRRALRNRAVRRVIHPERLRSLERRFRRNGEWAVLACRFVPGLRLPAWFTAGTLGMSYPRFLLADAIGAAIMTPIFVLLGRASGEKIAELEQRVEDLHQILGFVLVAVIAVAVIHFGARWTSRRGRAAPSPKAPAAPTPGRSEAWDGVERRRTGRRVEDLADGDRP